MAKLKRVILKTIDYPSKVLHPEDYKLTKKSKYRKFINRKWEYWIFEYRDNLWILWSYPLVSEMTEEEKKEEGISPSYPFPIIIPMIVLNLGYYVTMSIDINPKTMKFKKVIEKINLYKNKYKNMPIIKEKKIQIEKKDYQYHRKKIRIEGIGSPEEVRTLTFSRNPKKPDIVSIGDIEAFKVGNQMVISEKTKVLKPAMKSVWFYLNKRYEENSGKEIFIYYDEVLSYLGLPHTKENKEKILDILKTLATTHIIQENNKYLIILTPLIGLGTEKDVGFTFDITTKENAPNVYNFLKKIGYSNFSLPLVERKIKIPYEIQKLREKHPTAINIYENILAEKPKPYKENDFKGAFKDYSKLPKKPFRWKEMRLKEWLEEFGYIRSGYKGEIKRPKERFKEDLEFLRKRGLIDWIANSKGDKIFIWIPKDIQ